jgi:hypothetical protein
VVGRRAIDASPADPFSSPIQGRKVNFMNRQLVAHNRPVFDQLHPSIYRAAVGLVVWFVLAAWIFFDAGATSPWR